MFAPPGRPRSANHWVVLVSKRGAQKWPKGGVKGRLGGDRPAIDLFWGSQQLNQKLNQFWTRWAQVEMRFCKTLSEVKNLVLQK